MTIWCKTLCYISNNAGITLEVQYPLQPVGYGEWGQYPVPVPGGSDVLAFLAQSDEDSMAGPTSAVIYQMPDGTNLAIWFNQNFPVASTSDARALISGPFSDRYSITMAGGWVPEGVGATWTLYLQLTPSGASPGSNSASNQYTR